MTNTRALITLSISALLATTGCGDDPTASVVPVTPRGGLGSIGSAPDSGASPTFTNDAGVASAEGPLPPLATDVALTAEFANTYAAFNLGKMTGLPRGVSIHGCVIANDDPNTLLVSSIGTEYSSADTGGAWKVDDAGVFRIRIKRDAKGHIYAFDGSAQLVVPSIRAATFAYGSAQVLFSTLMPTNAEFVQPSISFVQFGAGLAGTEKSDFGGITKNYQGDFALGLVFAPSDLAGAGGARVVVHRGTEQRFDWYELAATYSGAKATFTAATKTAELSGKTVLMGLAYVPTGSPGFPVGALMVSGAELDTASGIFSPEIAWAYAIDKSGTPLPNERRPFLRESGSKGASGLQGLHFEPTTGDFLFVTADRLYQVRGFVPPPAPK